MTGILLGEPLGTVGYNVPIAVHHDCRVGWMSIIFNDGPETLSWPRLAKLEFLAFPATAINTMAIGLIAESIPDHCSRIKAFWASVNPRMPAMASVSHESKTFLNLIRYV